MRVHPVVAKAIATFPPTFGLRAFPGRVFAINGPASFLASGDWQLVVDLVQPDGTRSSFSRGTLAELLFEVVEAPK